VLLLHGLGGQAGTWDGFVDKLTGSLELWDVELPWRSMADTEWSHRSDPVDLLIEAVDDGGFDALVAHSFAANLLIEAFAAGRLEQRPAVLVSPFYRSAPADFDWPTISFYLNDFHRIFAEALRVGATGRFAEAHRDWMALRLRDHIGPYGWMRFFETYLRSPFLDLTAITAPLLILTGETDLAARPGDGRALADALPDARFALLERCGHFPMIEEPGHVARLVDEFLTLTRVPEQPTHAGSFT
jgi:pimeloyl-ACP methyl ester carboxylesterase